MKLNSSKAFSLLELLLVIIVISVILVSSLNLYHRYKFERDIALIKQDAEQLGQSLNLYYYRHCHELVPSGGKPLQMTVTLAQLQGDGLLPAKSLVTVPGVVFSMYIRTDYSWKAIYQLWVFATIDRSMVEVDYIRGFLKAVNDPREPTAVNTIGWMHLPSQKIATMDSANWIMNSTLQQFSKATRDPKKAVSVCPY